ncbi:signal protein [Actinomadura pelletieri]|uniref:signal protein n=1 Tax=Actinomadura pelletieri TaxID=111805 RepID=UPI001B85C568|nr:signal protein [Actinomadura pelletieri]
MEDTDGAHCAVGQPNDLWFLAGTFGGTVRRTCTVPPGRDLVAPIVNLHGSKTDCADFMSTASGTLTVDGKASSVQRWSATPITVTGVAGNPVTRAEGSVDAYGCGLWGVVRSLPPGSHQVRIRGGSGDFKLAVDYELTVQG